MFKSDTSEDDGVTDPDGISITTSEDPHTGEVWLIVEWYGDQYEDAWIAMPRGEFDILDDNL